MAVDSGFAAWLKSPALYTAVASPNAAAWATQGVETEIISPIAGKAEAVAEATRQVAFLAGPNATDRITVKGRRKDLIARPITVTGDRLGYEASPAVFVLGATENDDGTTTLLVLKRLAA